MDAKYWYFIAGVSVGWVTKFPLILKWYKELKETRDYQDRKRRAFADEVKRLEEIYKKDKTK